MATSTLTSPASTSANTPFVDRRGDLPGGSPVRERRQFTNSYDELTDEAAELAHAIDAYKAQHRRRFINYEEVLSVVKTLGYTK